MPVAPGVVKHARVTPTASENSDLLSFASGEITDLDLVTDRLTPVLAALDVEGAVRLLDQIMADRDPNRAAQSILTEVFQRLTELDSCAAWRWAESNRWPRGLLPMAKFVLRSYAQVDPSEVERIAERLPDGQLQTAAWSALARAVWPMEATRAISYLRKCRERDANALELFAVEIASSPSGDVDALWSAVEALPNREALLGQIVAAVAHRDPESGMKLLREQRRVLSPGEAENLERKIIVVSCERDPAAALRALQQLPAGEGRLFAGGQIFRRWVQVDSKSAWEAAMGLPDGPEKSAALVAMTSEEIIRDPGRLESFLAVMPSQSNQNALTLLAISAMSLTRRVGGVPDGVGHLEVRSATGSDATCH